MEEIPNQPYSQSGRNMFFFLLIFLFSLLFNLLSSCCVSHLQLFRFIAAKYVDDE